MNKELEKKLKEHIREQNQEMYITDEEICKLIFRYIKKENTEYAVLINGKWGAGKKFFVKNSLKTNVQKEINKTSRYKGIIYISLYGIKDLTQLENKLIYSIIENNILGNKEGKTSKILINGAKTYINSLERKDSIMDVIKMFQEISKYIIIFDDLERCMISITELLGYINELVEHKNVKTILIANEEKMSETKELYQNQVYFEIKEKLIGEVIYYNPDMEKILDYICDKEKEQIASKIIKNNKYEIIETMQKLKYKNIRTLKICISKFKIIIEKMEEVKSIYKNYDELTYNKLLNNILIYLLHVTIMYKENIKLYDWNNLLGSFGLINLTMRNDKIEILGFKFVDKLVQYSIIDSKDIKEILELYNKKDQNNIYGKGSPFDVVTNFFGKSDNKVEEALKQMKNEIKDNIYMIDVYSKILCYLLEIKWAGYDEKIIKDIIKLMEYNIKNNKNSCTIEFIPFTLGYNTERPGYYDILKKWEKYDSERVIENQKEKIKEILNKTNWGTNFKEYCEKNKNEFKRNKSFFSSIDDKELIENIKYSDSQNILEFIRGINTVYNLKYISKDQKELRDYYIGDIDSIIRIKKEIEKIKDIKMEKSKKYLINKLLEILQDWINALK